MSLQPSNSKHSPMAYFFHLRGKSLVQKSLRGMLMELLYQVLEKYPRSFELIRPIFMNLKRLKQDWDIRSLSKAILHIPYIPPAVPGCRDHITIFVDALDENQNQDDNNTLLSIFDNLNTTYKGVRVRLDSPLLKICLASRPWPIFQQRLGDDPKVPSFAIHDFTTNDIQEYTNSRLLTTSHLLHTYGERQKAIAHLSADIASRAKGVFIWVRVVVDNLRQNIIDGTPIESLQYILREYPEELDEMYKFTLKRIRGQYRPETKIVFKVMLASRVPLTVQQLFTVTNICIGLDASNYHDIISWLASRSGGLINVFDTGAGEQLSVVSGGDAEPTSDSSISANLHVEFLHQTVQYFVRHSLDDFLEVAKTKSAVAHLSGSRLLALACLDSHPPHPHLWDVAKDIFSYIREVEREEDETKNHQMTCLPRWTSYDLHDFPFRIRDKQGCPQSTTPETLVQYLDLNNEIVAKLIGRSKRSKHFFDGEIPKDMIPFAVATMHNLYHARDAQHPLILAPESRQSIRRLLLFIASIGPRLSNDRLDRPRMFRNILASYALPVRDTFPVREPFPEVLNQLPFKPINDLFECIATDKLRASLAAILVALKPSTEIDDDTLLSFAEGLDGEGYKDTLTVKGHPPALFPEMRGFYSVQMTLSAFCSRFREDNRSKWVDLFSKTWDDAPPDLQLNYRDARSFVDLAAWDAMGRKPPRHVYTTTSFDADMVFSLVPQTIASAGIPAVVVGLGGSRIFRAFYPGMAV